MNLTQDQIVATIALDAPGIAAELDNCSAALRAHIALALSGKTGEPKIGTPMLRKLSAERLSLAVLFHTREAKARVRSEAAREYVQTGTWSVAPRVPKA